MPLVRPVTLMSGPGPVVNNPPGLAVTVKLVTGLHGSVQPPAAVKATGAATVTVTLESPRKRLDMVGGVETVAVVGVALTGAVERLVSGTPGCGPAFVADTWKV